MIRRNIKIWSAAGAVAVGSVAAASAASAADEFTGGTLDYALEKVFAGEGGEGGVGFTKMNRSFSVPALTESQLRQVFSGNTLAAKGRVSAHLRADGTIDGWFSIDEEVKPFSRCPKENFSGDNMFVHDGQCMHRSFEQFKAAKWSIKGDQLCVPNSVGFAEAPGAGCYYAALVLNNVVLFGEDGKMVGKGRDLSKGKNVPPMPANK